MKTIVGIACIALAGAALAQDYPKLKPGGVFAGHDYPWHEVKKAVDEHAAANGYEVAQIGRVWMKRNSKP